MRPSWTNSDNLAIMGISTLLAINVCLFALQLHLNDLAIGSLHGNTTSRPNAKPFPIAEIFRLPYPVLFRDGMPSEKIHVFLLLEGLAQAGALFVLWRLGNRLIDSVAVRTIVFFAISATVLLALSARSVTAFDIYAYVGYGKLGFLQAYAPGHGSFSGSFAPVSKLWGIPMVPCFYGPLWLAAETIVVRLGGDSLTGAIIATRILGFLSLLGVAGALLLLRMPPIFAILLLLNPAVAAYYIVDGHNDAFGILFVLLAFTVSSPILAAALIACGGLVKITFLGFACIVFRGRNRLIFRSFWVLVACAIVAVATYATTGSSLIALLKSHAIEQHQLPTAHHQANALAFRALEFIAFGTLIAAFFFGRTERSWSWSLYTLTGMSYPWYLLWGLPYAALERSGLAIFLIALPIAMPMISSDFENLHFETFAMAALVIYAIYGFFKSARLSRSSAVPIGGSMR